MQDTGQNPYLCFVIKTYAVMKKSLIGFLLVLMSFQTMAVGHPHNLFAARKQLRAKEVAAVPASKTANKPAWTITQQVKSGVETSCRLVTLLRKIAGS